MDPCGQAERPFSASDAQIHLDANAARRLKRVRKCWITHTSMTSKDWKIRRLKIWQNGSGKDYSPNAPGSARSSCTKRPPRAASIAAHEIRREGQPRSCEPT